MKRSIYRALIAAASLAFPPSLSAAVNITGYSNAAGQSAFDSLIQTNDLAASAIVTGTTPSLGSLAGYTDGLGSPIQTDTNATLTNDAYLDGSAGFGTANLLSSSPSVTFSFNTNGSAGGLIGGYTINSIVTTYGWHDHASMSDQDYSVSYSTVTNPTAFSPLTNVAYNPFNPSNDLANSGTQNHSSLVTINDSSGVLATSVAAVKITFSAYRNSTSVEQAGQLVREIDITSSSVPTPPPPAVSILPLGDSITDGYSTPGGYRIKLYQNLGGNFQFLGSQVNGPTTLPDKHNEGHSGYRIDQLDDDLNGLVPSSPAPDTNNGGYWLTGGHGTARSPLNPNIVLLHIGTNDASQGYSAAVMESRLTQLLSDLKFELPHSQFIVASLIPRTDSAADEAVQEQYNAAMPGIVAQFGPDFHFFDMHDVLTGSDLADGVHPTLAGYNKMADAWTGAIVADVPEPTSIWELGLAAASLRRRRAG